MEAIGSPAIKVNDDLAHHACKHAARRQVLDPDTQSLL